MNGVDPLPGETGERSEVRVIGEPLGLEPMVEAASRTIALPPTIQRIAGQRPSRSASLTSSYPAGRTPTAAACPPDHGDRSSPFNQVLVRDVHQAERVIEFAMGQQACIGGDARTVELQLEAAVEIETESFGIRFTRLMRHQRV